MNWFNKDVEEVSKTLNTDLEKGLSEQKMLALNILTKT